MYEKYSKIYISIMLLKDDKFFLLKSRIAKKLGVVKYDPPP